MNFIKELKKKCQYTKVGGDYIFHRLFYRKLSIYITSFLIRTPITAAWVTIISLLMGLLGGFFLSFGKSNFYLIGALFFNLFVILDLVDGELARYRGTQGMRGQYLDLLVHYFVTASIFFGLSFGLYREIGNIYIFIFGFTAAISSIMAKTSLTLVYHSVGMQKKGFFNISQNKDTFKEENSNIKKFMPSKLISAERFYRKYIEEFACDLLIIMAFTIFTILNIFLPPLKLFSYQINYMAIYFIFYGIFLPLDLIKKIVYTIYSNQFSVIYNELFKNAKQDI